MNGNELDCVRKLYPFCGEGTWRSQSGNCLDTNKWRDHCSSVSFFVSLKEIFSILSYFFAFVTVTVKTPVLLQKCLLLTRIYILGL